MKFAIGFAVLALCLPSSAQDSQVAIRKALAALDKSKQADGHWGGNFKIAITAIGGLAILAADEEPLKNESLWSAFDWLVKQQKEGDWPAQGHTWLHSQGFATLFMAELYGKVLLAKAKPSQVDPRGLRSLVEKAALLLVKAQSSTGGWFYHKAAGSDQHEGSTTVCAVQALRAARNFGIAIDPAVLDKGFAYLKKTQNADGGFQYQLGSGGSMVAGTAGALSTLVLMSRLDEKVLFNGVDFLKARKIEGVAADRFPYYGLFYAMMAMKVIDEEYGKHIPAAKEWLAAISLHLVKSQKEDGTWDRLGWMRDQEPSADYSTAMAALTLAVVQSRLSVFRRDPPNLEGAAADELAEWKKKLEPEAFGARYPALVESPEAEKPEDRRRRLRAIGALCDFRSVPHLMDAFDKSADLEPMLALANVIYERYWEARNAADRKGYPDFFPSSDAFLDWVRQALRHATKRDDPNVGAHAARILFALGGRKEMAELEAAMASRHPAQRDAAAAAAREIAARTGDEVPQWAEAHPK
jgi:hypothetical protein